MKAWRGGDPVFHVLVGRDVRRARRAQRHARTKPIMQETAILLLRIASCRLKGV